MGSLLAGLGQARIPFATLEDTAGLARIPKLTHHGPFSLLAGIYLIEFSMAGEAGGSRTIVRERIKWRSLNSMSPARGVIDVLERTGSDKAEAAARAGQSLLVPASHAARWDYDVRHPRDLQPDLVAPWPRPDATYDATGGAPRLRLRERSVAMPSDLEAAARLATAGPALEVVWSAKPGEGLRIQTHVSDGDRTVIQGGHVWWQVSLVGHQWVKTGVKRKQEPRVLLGRVRSKPDAGSLKPIRTASQEPARARLTQRAGVAAKEFGAYSGSHSSLAETSWDVIVTSGRPAHGVDARAFTQPYPRSADLLWERHDPAKTKGATKQSALEGTILPIVPGGDLFDDLNFKSSRASSNGRAQSSQVPTDVPEAKQEFWEQKPALKSLFAQPALDRQSDQSLQRDATELWVPALGQISVASLGSHKLPLLWPPSLEPKHSHGRDGQRPPRLHGLGTMRPRSAPEPESIATARPSGDWPLSMRAIAGSSGVQEDTVFAMTRHARVSDLNKGRIAYHSTAHETFNTSPFQDTAGRSTRQSDWRGRRMSFVAHWRHAIYASIAAPHPGIIPAAGCVDHRAVTYMRMILGLS